MTRVKPKPPTRACGARPSAGGEPRPDGLAGKGPETERGQFLEECALGVGPTMLRYS